jgi:outer membrane protein OmpA-like peptidoglycan-associated protein
MADSYSWQSPGTDNGSAFRTETSRNLGWWILTAVLISIALHVALYIGFGSWKLQQETRAAEEEVIFRNQQQQLVIDQQELSEILPQAEPESSGDEKPEIADMSKTLDQLDEFDIFELAPDEITLTPAVEDLQVFATGGPAAPKSDNSLRVDMGSMDLSVADAVSKDLKEMRERLLDAEVAATEQPVLELNSNEFNATSDSEIFFRKAASEATGDDGKSITDGYSNLDDLLMGAGGGIPGGTKPILMPTDLLFESNAFELREEASLSMMKLAFLIQTNPDAKFIIEGHTDTIGTDDYNFQLSLRRAGAVRDWLLNRLKIAADNIQAVGYGKTRPIDGVPTDGTTEEQSLNRRVEIVIRNNKKPSGEP